MYSTHTICTIGKKEKNSEQKKKKKQIDSENVKRENENNQ